MTKNEFIKANHAHGCRVTRSFLLIFTLLVIGTIGFIVLFLHSPHVRAWFTDSSLTPFQFSLRFFAPFTFLCIAGCGYLLSADRKAGTTLSCPHCKRCLAGRPGLSVVASGQCPFCGQRAIDQDEENR